MTAAPQPALTPTPNKLWMLWTGRVLSLLPVLIIALGVASVFLDRAQVVVGMAKFGWPESFLNLMVGLEIACSLLYLFPRTAVLGAILLTGYFGGAIATHLRIHDPGWPLALVCGILTWAGLYLRDPRLRTLLPLRRPQ